MNLVRANRQQGEGEGGRGRVGGATGGQGGREGVKEGFEARGTGATQPTTLAPAACPWRCTNLGSRLRGWSWKGGCHCVGTSPPGRVSRISLVAAGRGGGGASTWEPGTGEVPRTKKGNGWGVRTAHPCEGQQGERGEELPTRSPCVAGATGGCCVTLGDPHCTACAARIGGGAWQGG